MNETIVIPLVRLLDDTSTAVQVSTFIFTFLEEFTVKFAYEPDRFFEITWVHAMASINLTY